MINKHYELQEENCDQLKSLCNNPKCDMILEILTDNRVQWKQNPNGQVVLFPLKSLSYRGKMWNHFIMATIIPSSNTSEVNKERVIYLYAIMENITFDVGESIETSIVMNTARKHNLGHPTLIF